MPDAEKPSRRARDMDAVRAAWQEARDLVKRLEGSTVQRLLVEVGEVKIEIERGSPGVASAAAPAPVAAAAAAAAPAPASGDGIAAAAEAERGYAIVAPLLGTFYRSPQPGAKPFVEEGDVVEAGQTVGIVEAMKLMNQVQADRAGRVSEIVAVDGEWVEFEQVLMYLVPVGE